MINTKSLKVLEYDKILAMLEPYTLSETGKAQVHLINPSTSYEDAKYQLELTAQADRILYTHSISFSFAFDDISECIKRAKKSSTLNLAEVLRVGRLLRTARIISSGIVDIPDSEIIDIKEMAKQLFISHTLEKDIGRAILSDTEMADTASPELRSIRQRINRCNDKIREKLNSYITSSSTVKYLQDNIITMRNNRYVIPVKSENRGHVSGLVHDQSASGNTVYIEPMMVVELNNELKMLYAQEENEIYRILREFTTRISLDANNIIYNQEILTKLDIIFAKAIFAKEIKATKPIINSIGKINIIKGRHPLINPQEVVPVSIKLGEDYKILMITGPNTGGKTVTLKLTGLLTLMGLSGMFIPAEQDSSISVFDDIWCDIGDEQSIEQSLSTFSSHMTNIINITKKIDDKSLILFDELGAGTDPQEGAALAMAITNYIINKKSYAVITTHYPELKEFSLLNNCIENASMDFDPETFRPTYSLVIGIPGSSNAIQIASRLGLDQQIVKKAKELLSEDKIKFENILIQAEQARRKADSTKEEIESNKQYIQEELANIKREKEKILHQKEKIEQGAEKETKRLVSLAMRDVNEIVDELKEMLQEEDIDIFRAHKLRKKLENISIDKENEPEEDIDLEVLDGTPKVGDKVYIKSLKNYGNIEKVGNKGEYTIKFGMISSTVKANDIIKVKDTGKEKAKVNVNKPIMQKAAETEIKLIGQSVEEAMYNLDVFINNAVVSNITELRVVHGKGTGKLRDAVQDYLKKSTIIAEYRRGKFGEGEGGVTIVKLK